MSVNKYSEVEVLKEEFNFLTDLLKEHKTHEAYYQKPQFYSGPYGHPSVYSRQKSVNSTNLNCLNVYNTKYHANRTSFKSQFGDRTGKITSRSFVHKPVPVSVFPKQSTGYIARQDSVWKRNKVPSCTQNLSNSSFKMVRTSGSAKVKNASSESRAVANCAKIVSGASISTCDKTLSSEASTSSTKEAEVSNFKKNPSKYTSSKKEPLQPLEKNMVDKLRKATKVSYVSCSDCIIEISEYENGELHMNQRKLDPAIEDSVESAFSGTPLSPVKKTKSSWSDTVCEKDSTKRLSKTVCTGNQHANGPLYQKPLSRSDSSATKQTTISKSVGMDIMSSSQRKSVSSLCKFTKSQHPCGRNAKYSKVNVSTSKSQNSSVAKLVLKNKYSVKKSNAVRCSSSPKCKISKELKGCTPNPLRCMHASKSAPQKCLVNYCTKRTILPVKSVNKQAVYMHGIDSQKQNHAGSKVAKSSFPPQSYKISRKAKALHMQNVYKVVNKPDAVANKALKGSQLCQILNKNSPSLLLRNDDHGSDKKWFKTSDSARSVSQCSSNAGAQQNRPNTMTKSETRKVLNSSPPHKTSSCELTNVFNTPKVISRHSLQRTVQRKSSVKKPSLNPSPKSFLDSRSPIKKDKVRLRKTPYKVVNRYANHVSQVVQMIKTKYRTVNKRSASNSHLKWLQEQKRAYLARKVKKPLRCPAKRAWMYNHSSTHRTRELPVLRSKASRKHSLERNKVLKNIRGVTYKVSKTQIKKSFTPKRIKKGHFALRNKKNSVIVNVHGAKFQMSPGGKSLKRLGTNKERNKTSLGRIKIRGSTYVQQREGSSCLVKLPSPTQNVASRMLHRSINTVRAAEAKKTLQKNNLFCMFFNRFGRCNKEGNCPYIHDPSKIAVCTRFLRGTCKISGCPFSHEISPGKMAVCSFFLQGNCTNSNCPYQHTSIKPGTKLCKAFVKGYCNKGSECQDAHILACPQFICEGFCEKGSSCTWPHPPMKNNVKKRSDPPEVSKETEDKDAAADDISDQRYFTYEPGLIPDKCVKLTESVEESIQTTEKIAKVRNKKIAFPKQPEFIPL